MKYILSYLLFFISLLAVIYLLAAFQHYPAEHWWVLPGALFWGLNMKTGLEFFFK